MNKIPVREYFEAHEEAFTNADKEKKDALNLSEFKIWD